MSRTRPNRRIRTTAAAAAVAAVAGCSGPAPVPPAPAAATSDKAAGTPAEEAKALALDAYRAMWQDMADAATTSDWQSPALARHATADALSTISRGLYADHYNGLVTKGAPVTRPTATNAQPAAAPSSVTVLDCGDDSNWLKYRGDTGQPANDGRGGRRRITALVKNTGDRTWKVAAFAVRDVGTC
ncbi:hypothetical protein [Amycolatopsis benzoatilytica]|uniref:hypothetical protein n=1 Tax=Amycolatopsis benzoatilytica TaxID=346045 RepID=UPI0003713665|nr:hypothetical protein [Amycolatopsis benzoatilytica]